MVSSQLPQVYQPWSHKAQEPQDVIRVVPVQVYQYRYRYQY